MSVLNKKAELYGLPVTDFYILICVEMVLFLVTILWLVRINAYFGVTFFIITGFLVYGIMNLKRFLPDRFFISLYKYLTEPKIYITTADINANHPFLKKLYRLYEELDNAKQ